MIEGSEEWDFNQTCHRPPRNLFISKKDNGARKNKERKDWEKKNPGRGMPLFDVAEHGIVGFKPIY